MTERPAAGAADPRHPAITALIGIVFLEALLVLGGTVLVVVEGAERGFTPMSIALVVTAGLILLTLLWLGSGLLRRRRRLLGGVLTWQVLQLGCSVIGFQGLLGPTWLGLVLLVPAIAGVVLCLARPVTAVYGPPAGERRG